MALLAVCSALVDWFIRCQGGI